MKHALAILAAGGLATLGLAAPASAAHEGSSYEGTLIELNDSGASGTATVTVSDDGETMAVAVTAAGLNLDGPHAMHIHGIVTDGEVSASSCPTMADDADGDGVLTVVEGASRYGSVQVNLTTAGDTSTDSALAVDRFPSGSSIDYSREGIPIPDALKPNLGKLHIVVHGIDENGNGTIDLDQEERSSLTDDLPREGTAPALCGTLAIQAMGPIQTGAGGLADAGTGPATPTTVGALGIGLAGLAGAAAVARRRRGVTA
jgi:hypothetical protein